MSLTHNAVFKIIAKATLAPAADLVGGQTAEVLVDESFAPGTGDRQASKVCRDIRTLSGSANEDLDLQTLTDGNGVALGLTKVRAIIVEADADNGADIRLSPGATNGWTALLSASGATDDPQIDVEAGGCFAACSPVGGYAVSGSSKVLNVENLDGSAVTYTITVIGI